MNNEIQNRPFESYQDNGQLWEQGFYKNGSKKGTFEIYQKNGQLMKKVYLNMENLNEGNVRTKS